MRLITALALGVFLTVSLLTAVSEHHRLARLESATGMEAMFECEALRARKDRLVFVDGMAVEIACEQGAARVLTAMVDSCAFSVVPRLAAEVMNEPESGAEIQAQTILMKLSARHIACVRQKLEDNTAFDPIAINSEIDLIERTYVDPPVGTQVADLRLLFHIAGARASLTHADFPDAIRHAVAVGTDAPLPLQNEAEELALAAIDGMDKHSLAHSDPAAFHRFLDEAVHTAAARANLQRQILDRKAKQETELFGQPIRAARAVPLISETRRAAGASVIRIENSANKPLRVMLRGPQPEEVTVPPNDYREIELKPGNYLQLASIENGAQQAFGVIEVENNQYQQLFSSDFLVEAKGRKA